jgi:hypothetical protein
VRSALARECGKAYGGAAPAGGVGQCVLKGIRTMWAGWEDRTHSRPTPARRRSSLRLQLEALEDRLAPHCTLPAIAQTDLPFGIPVVACTADDATAPPAAQVYTTDIAGLGVDGATELTVVFHLERSLSSAPVLEYFDSAAGTWRVVRPSAQVPNALSIDSANGRITIVFDDPSSPSLASLNGRLFRVEDAGALMSLVVAGSTSAPAGSAPELSLAKAPLTGASGFVAADPFTAAPFLFDTRGALTPADHAAQPEFVFQTHAAFWSDPTGADALDSGDALPEPAPPAEPGGPARDAAMMAQSRDALGPADAIWDQSRQSTPAQPAACNADVAPEDPDALVLLPRALLSREIIVQRTHAQGGPARLLLVTIVFGWGSLRGPKLLDRLSRRPNSRQRPRHPDRSAGRLWHPRHSTTIPRAPPRMR